MTTSGKTILLAGGAGYLGSHAAVELLKAGHRVVVVDDLSNCQENPDDLDDLPPSLWRVKQITGKECLHFIRGNVCDKEKMSAVFDMFNIDTICDFSGKKAVGESTEMPMYYYQTNLTGMLKHTWRDKTCGLRDSVYAGTMTLLRCMKKHGIRNFIFSSSCTVYGAPDPDNLPVTETNSVGQCYCPYAKSKYFCESLLEDMSAGEPDYWRILIMRYFNPIGAHESGLLGEDPKGEPRNLMPKLAQVAIGKHPIIHFFGDDYPTEDGSPIRDYVHVVDVAKAHCNAIKKLESIRGVKIYNIGSGRGTSTWNMVRSFERACNKKIALTVVPRRPGDVPEIYCDPSKANRELEWRAEKSIDNMCEDLWKFYRLNPNGYQDITMIRESGLSIEY